MRNIVKRILGFFLLISSLPILVFIYVDNGIDVGEAIRGVAYGLGLALVIIGLFAAGLKLFYD